ncbi:hypothetical protein NDU88_002261 [Pleurodeles waltl]|uniref:Uncharacterized protein n=1 Tax=Pleurodeles waltl TaxID=8319 RepID=A0AAV7T1X0_PLEWA|nr:hypothetical protein NDU88_002261 [Pleurodeles waltl]
MLHQLDEGRARLLAGHRYQDPRCLRQVPWPEVDSAIQAARQVGPCPLTSTTAPYPGGRPPLLRASRLRQALLRSQRSNSPPGTLFQQAPAAGPPRHFSHAPYRARACRSSEPGRPRTLLGPARYSSAPPKGAGARDRWDLGRHSSSARLPHGRRRPQSPCMPPDKPGRTQSSLSSRPPLLLAWPCPLG